MCGASAGVNGRLRLSQILLKRLTVDVQEKELRGLIGLGSKEWVRPRNELRCRVRADGRLVGASTWQRRTERSLLREDRAECGHAFADLGCGAGGVAQHETRWAASSTSEKAASKVIAFLPQFVTEVRGMVELSAVFMLLTFVVFVGYGSFAAAIRHHVLSRPRVLVWIRRVFAGAFAVLGVSLAFA